MALVQIFARPTIFTPSGAGRAGERHKCPYGCLLLAPNASVALQKFAKHRVNRGALLNGADARTLQRFLIDGNGQVTHS